MTIYKYFISYYYKKSNKRGFGNGIITTDGKINSGEILNKYIEIFIERIHPDDLKILDFSLLEVENDESNNFS